MNTHGDDRLRSGRHVLDVVPRVELADALLAQLVDDGGEDLGVGRVEEDDLGLRERQTVDLDLLRTRVLVSPILLPSQLTESS